MPVKQVNPQRCKGLGANLLRLGEKTLSPERKTAAMLIYLALAGPTSPSRAALAEFRRGDRPQPPFTGALGFVDAGNERTPAYNRKASSRTASWRPW